MLDPGRLRPGLPRRSAQDAQAEAFDYPEALLRADASTASRARGPTATQLAAAAELLQDGQEAADHRRRRRALFAAPRRRSAAFAERHGIPVAETIAGRGVLVHDHPLNVGPIGVIGSTSANALAAEADVVLAIGTRLQDFTTGSWTRLRSPTSGSSRINAARFDATKHRALPVVGDAREALDGARRRRSAAGRRPTAWTDSAAKLNTPSGTRCVDRRSGPTNAELPTYAQVVGAVNRMAGDDATSRSPPPAACPAS